MYVAGKVAVITGGAFGLGLLYAKELLKNGLKGVTLIDINSENGEDAVENITKEYGPGKAIFIKADVVNKNQIEGAIKKTVETFGNFDILINNAGIMNDSVWEKQIDINIKGVMNGTVLAFEEYLPKYKSDDSEPIIINISSIAGLSPAFFMPVYCATKAAVIMLSKSFAEPLNYTTQKVRVITVCPGATATTLLDALETRSFSPRHVPLLSHEDFLTKGAEPLQSPEEMASAMVKIIENAQTGDVWVVRAGKIQQVDFPIEKDMKILKELE